jgi:hypothetical protein
MVQPTINRVTPTSTINSPPISFVSNTPPTQSSFSNHSHAYNTTYSHENVNTINHNYYYNHDERSTSLSESIIISELPPRPKAAKLHPYSKSY